MALEQARLASDPWMAAPFKLVLSPDCTFPGGSANSLAEPHRFSMDLLMAGKDFPGQGKHIWGKVLGISPPTWTSARFLFGVHKGREQRLELAVVAELSV